MKTQLNPSLTGIRLLGASALLVILNACQTPAANRAALEKRDAEMARILDLRATGVITDEQALKIMAALVGSTPAPAAGKPAAAPSSVPPAAPAAPAAPSAPTPAAPPPLATLYPAPTPAPAVAAKDPRYSPKVVLTGRLRSIGSDTMDGVVARWEEIFVKYHPTLRIMHEGRGSSTGTPALVDGQADFAPMSRALLDAEAVKFRERFGYDATQIRVAIDALGVYVHPENPIAKTGLTLAQLDAVFSSTRKRGGTEQLTTWGQLGLTGVWANAPINAYGRNKASGTYGYFRDSALGKGEFGAWVSEQDGSAQVVAKVAADKFGIGYSGVGYRTPGVAMTQVAEAAGQPFVSPAEDTAINGSYALARSLFLTTNRNPASPPSDLQREFIEFVLGPIGQEVVKKEGYYPLPARIVAEEIAKLR
jgi:phosphate transport system substrate-binding protein